MRRWAFVALVIALLLAGQAEGYSDAHQMPAQPLACKDLVIHLTSGEEQTSCLDAAFRTACPQARSGYRYEGCRELGAMPGAVLIMRGLPLSASQASADDLVALRGVGPGIAGKLVAERANGPFCGTSDLRRVSGIGEKRAAAISPHLVFDDPRCVAAQPSRQTR